MEEVQGKKPFFTNFNKVIVIWLVLNASVAYVHIYDFSFVAIIAYLFLFVFFASFALIMIKNFLTDNEQNLQNQGLPISEEWLQNAYVDLYTWINNKAQKFRDVIVGKSLWDTFKCLLILYFFSWPAYIFGDWWFFVIGLNILVWTPYVYSREKTSEMRQKRKELRDKLFSKAGNIYQSKMAPKLNEFKSQFQNRYAQKKQE